MKRKTGIRYWYIAELVGKSERTVESYFYRRGWKVRNIDQVRTYLTTFLPSNNER